MPHQNQRCFGGWHGSKKLTFWLRGPDSNWRPSGYEPDELTAAPPRNPKIPKKRRKENTKITKKRRGPDSNLATFGNEPRRTDRLLHPATQKYQKKEEKETKYTKKSGGQIRTWRPSVMSRGELIGYIQKPWAFWCQTSKMASCRQVRTPLLLRRPTLGQLRGYT